MLMDENDPRQFNPPPEVEEPEEYEPHHILADRMGSVVRFVDGAVHALVSV